MDEVYREALFSLGEEAHRGTPKESGLTWTSKGLNDYARKGWELVSASVVPVDTSSERYLKHMPTQGDLGKYAAGGFGLFCVFMKRPGSLAT